MAAQLPPQFENFSVRSLDVHEGNYRTKYNDQNYPDFSVAGNCNNIVVDFRLKGSFGDISTTIYDGERIFEVEQALAKGVRTEQDIEEADSSFYNMLKPLVDKYFETYRKNQQLIKSA